MNIRKATRLLLGMAAGALLLVGARAFTQSTARQQPQQQQLPELIYSVKGSDLFGTYCATCHGADAKGGGPVAPALKTKVPDLTVLAKNNRGQFPSARVRRIISGDEVLLTHGRREMPIWGPIFHQVERDQDLGNVRLENLTRYLESIQQK